LSRKSDYLKLTNLFTDEKYDDKKALIAIKHFLYMKSSGYDEMTEIEWNLTYGHKIGPRGKWEDPNDARKVRIKEKKRRLN
jgi:hypothetical protein